jgi:hypothetical protein
MLYDAVDRGSADNTPVADREGVVPNGAAVWGYNLLPLAAGSYFPHFVIEISNIDVVDDTSPEYGKYENTEPNELNPPVIPTFYLTVKGVASQSLGSLDLVKGNVYHIDEVLFSLSDLSPIPEPADKNVRCLVTITKWVATTVTPSF